MDPHTPLTIAAARYQTRPEAAEAFKTRWALTTEACSTIYRWRFLPRIRTAAELSDDRREAKDGFG